jgi:SAM-dependent methyltransferase
LPAQRPIILEIGCGNAKHPGRIGLDILPLPAVDVLADATGGLPFADSTVDYIHISHVLEHVAGFVTVMEELWRVCKPNAWVSIRGPHMSCGLVTWKDPTHLRPLTLETFRYFEPGHLYNYYTKARFRLERARLFLLTKGRLKRVPWPLDFLAVVVNGMANYSRKAQYRCERWWGPLVGIEELHVLLRVLK